MDKKDVDKLMGEIMIHNRLKKATDKELIAQFIDVVYADLPILGEKEMVTSELIRRFEKKIKVNLKLNSIAVKKPRQIACGEWLYKGCFIQESEHSKLIGKYEVFKNDKPQSHVGRSYTFGGAKRLCIENECFENTLNFN